MKNIYRAVLMLAFTVSALSVEAQQLFLSQYQHSSVFSNIGMTADLDYTRAGLHYRNMSLTEGNGIQTSALSVTHPFNYKDNNRRFGAVNVSVGDIRTGAEGVNVNTIFSAGFTYNLGINKFNDVGIGIQGSFGSRRTDVSKWKTRKMFVNGQFDPAAESGEKNVTDNATTYGINLGASWINRDENGYLRFFAGVSAFDLSSSGTSYSGATLETPYSVVGNVGISALRLGRVHFIPMTRWIYSNDYNTVDGTLLTRYYFGDVNDFNSQGYLGVSAGYRNNSVAVLAMEYDRTQYAIGASFDFPFANKGDGLTPNNALEITFVWKGWRKSNSSQIEYPVEVPEVAIEETPIEDEVTETEEKPAEEVAEEKPVEQPIEETAIEDVAQEDVPAMTEEEEEDEEEKHPYYEEAVQLDEVKLNFNLSGHQPPKSLSEELVEIAALLKSDKTLVLRISGHACTLGDKSYNIYLSEKRAKLIRDELIKLDVPAEQIVTVGYGSSRPKADNKTEEGRKQNRRVEFDLLQKIGD